MKKNVVWIFFVDKRDTGVLDESNDNEEEEKNEEAEYYNCYSARMNIKVEDLFSYVTKDHIDCFVNEFKVM